MDGICVEVMTDLATYFSDDWAPTTLYAARGRLIPFNSNSPTGSTFTAFSTFVSTQGLIKIASVSLLLVNIESNPPVVISPRSLPSKVRGGAGSGVARFHFGRYRAGRIEFALLT